MATDELFSESLGGRNSAPDILIVFTDGESNVDEQLTIPMAIQVIWYSLVENKWIKGKNEIYDKLIH